MNQAGKFDLEDTRCRIESMSDLALLRFGRLLASRANRLLKMMEVFELQINREEIKAEQKADRSDQGTDIINHWEIRPKLCQSSILRSWLI
jgi:hypothetical protein